MKPAPLPVVVLLAGLSALPPSLLAAGLDCKKSPRKALPILVARAMKEGEEQLLGAAPAELVGWKAPTKMLVFHSPGGTIFFQVIVKAGEKPDEIVPTELLIGSMVSDSANRERDMFRTTLDGKLEEEGLYYNQLDGSGKEGEAVTEHFERRGPHDPRAVADWSQLLKRLCPFALEAGPRK